MGFLGLLCFDVAVVWGDVGSLLEERLVFLTALPPLSHAYAQGLRPMLSQNDYPLPLLA